MAKDHIVFIGTPGANDALRALMEDYCAAVVEAGESAITVDVGEQAEFESLASLMRASHVRFAVTWLGALQDLAFEVPPHRELVNAFELLGIPLVKIQGDMPAYYRGRHRDVPRNSASLYQADEFLAYRTRFMPEATALAALLAPMPMMPKRVEQIDVKRRLGGKLVFQKNGNSASALVELWRERLPRGLANMTCELAESIRGPGLAPGRLDIGNYVFEYLISAGGIEFPGNDTVAFFTAQLDDYLRRVKSTMIGEAIVDFPVVVQGSFWDHIDFSGKPAIHICGTDVHANQSDVETRLGVIDMSANVDTWPHDRIQRAVGTYALAVTNEQGWLRDEFADFSALTFRFEPESIQQRIAAVLRNPGDYIDRGIAFAESFRQKHPRSAFVEQLISAGELASLGPNHVPQILQPFFVSS